MHVHAFDGTDPFQFPRQLNELHRCSFEQKILGSSEPSIHSHRIIHPSNPINHTQSSDLCLNTVVQVFRADVTGEASLELVRLLNRMIKERKFKVHPNVLSCLSHLRLRNELGVRSSVLKADRPTERDRERGGKKYATGRAAQRRAKGKTTDQPHLSKKAKKAMKERQEIQKEMREAEAEVDKEERAAAVRFSSLLCVLFQMREANPPSSSLS